MKISTRQFFESAHRLTDYEGDCKRIHGHNWIVDIDILTDPDEGLDKTGFVVDFKEIQQLMKKFDHLLILKDCEENIKIVESIPADWIVWTEFNPTCENLALHFKKVLAEKFNMDESCITIKVYETYKPIKKSYAEV